MKKTTTRKKKSPPDIGANFTGLSSLAAVTSVLTQSLAINRIADVLERMDARHAKLERVMVILLEHYDDLKQREHFADGPFDIEREFMPSQIVKQILGILESFKHPQDATRTDQ